MMSEDRRRFALRDNGKEISVFENKTPREAALKAARRLDPRESEADAAANPERIRLREHGTIDVHIYDAWAWEIDAPENAPTWLGDTVTQANVTKIDVETTSKSEKELEYNRLESLLVDQPIAVRKVECKNCGTSLDDSVVSVTMVDEIPDPIDPIQYKRFNYKCDDCGVKNRATNPNCPSNGSFGTNALAQAVLLYYKYRLSYGKISQLFEELYNYRIPPASVVHTCDYLYPFARSIYERIQGSIQKADILYVDETQFPVRGENYWLWGFTNGEKTLYTLRESRGSVVLEEILGDEFDGIIVCDGWSAYSAYHPQLQRCWAHLLREKESLSEDDIEAKAIYEDLQDLHKGLKEFLDTNPSPLQRIVVQREARETLANLISKGAKSEAALDALQMIQGGLGDWLTFVVYPNVDSTNNRAENIIRESVIRRKTMGALREDKGVKSYETFQSLIRTWKQQGRNPYIELRQLAQEINDVRINEEDGWH